MLGDIVQLLKSNGAMSVTEIAAAQNLEKGVLKPMLELLERKGRICKIGIDCTAGCASCNCKDSDALTSYRAAPYADND